MRTRFIDFPKYSCIIGRIWLTLAKSLESVVFIEKAANFSLKLLIFRDFCKYNLLIIKCLTIEFYFLSSTKILVLLLVMSFPAVLFVEVPIPYYIWGTTAGKGSYFTWSKASITSAVSLILE